MQFTHHAEMNTDEHYNFDNIGNPTPSQTYIDYFSENILKVGNLNSTHSFGLKSKKNSRNRNYRNQRNF
jgi:hypothetical protein